MDLFKLMSERRSYRSGYTNAPVPREDLIKIMQAGLDAPSGSNKQTTSLVTVDEPELLEKVTEILNIPMCNTAPALICVLTQPIDAYKGMKFNVQDYSAAIQNMLLAAVELGYQSCWIEGQVTGSSQLGLQVANVLKVPADYELICILPVGVAEKPLKEVVKKPFEERAWFNEFGSK
jgi:nitroreductase